jgi:hypothetical protein
MLLQGLTSGWPTLTWIGIHVVFWALFIGSLFRLDLSHLKHFGDTSA